MTQGFEPASGYEIRDELQDLLVRDLLGPWDGPAEMLPDWSRGPRERYLVGMLGPRPAPGQGDDAEDTLPDLDLGGDGSGDSELPEVMTPQHVGRLWASSMGLSFAVAAEVSTVAVRVGWGEYHPEKAESDEGRTQTRWVRTPVDHDLEVPLDGEPDQSVPLAEDVELRVRVRPRGERRVVRLSLVNGQPERRPHGDDAWLFQPELTVTALDGEASVFLPADDPLDPNDGHLVGDDPEERPLRLLYRDRLRFATGHNVAVHAETRPGQRRAWRLTTTWLPTYEVAQVTAAGAASGVPLGMDELAELAESPEPGALATALGGLVDGYNQWLAAQETRAESVPATLREAAEAALHRARQVAGRIRAGVALLAGNDSRAGQARRAFAFANRAMAAQRRATAIGALRAEDPSLSYQDATERVSAPEQARWRPFQLAFVLLNLPSLTDPGHQDRRQRHHHLHQLPPEP